MKREIKFRAWIVESWDDDDNPKYVMTYDLAFEEYEPIDELLNGVEHLMQFTGLKDKNGKEIYEGDIVFYEDHEWEVVLEYDRWDMKNGEVYVRSNDERDDPGFTDWEKSEVIGNIYENPELIK